MKKLITLSLISMLALSIFAQNAEGDALMNIVGSKTDAPATASFLKAYDINHATDARYTATKTGIDMTAKNDTLISMTLYKNNPLYGGYTHKLPKGLTFDMSSSDVVKKLGKPTTSYMNSGYSEYAFDKYVLTCWFESGVLRRVTISLK